MNLKNSMNNIIIFFSSSSEKKYAAAVIIIIQIIHNFNKIDGIEKYKFEVNPIYFSIQIHTEYNKVLFQYNSYI